MDANKLISELTSKLKAAAVRTEEEIIAQIPSLIAYDLLTGQKYELTDDYNPPWDASGHLVSSNMPDQSLFMNHYQKVKDFFEEFTGNSFATYISGWGLNHETYRDHYGNWMAELYSFAHHDTFDYLNITELQMIASELLNTKQTELFERRDLINELCDAVEVFEDNSMVYAEETCSKIEGMDLHFVFKLGEQQAKERLDNLQRERRRINRRTQFEKADFDRFWLLLEKKYKLAYKRPFPNRIEMSDFESFRNFLINNHVQQKERILIGEYAPISLSNSVSAKLQQQW